MKKEDTTTDNQFSIENYHRLINQVYLNIQEKYNFDNIQEFLQGITIQKVPEDTSALWFKNFKIENRYEKKVFVIRIGFNILKDSKEIADVWYATVDEDLNLLHEYDSVDCLRISDARRPNLKDNKTVEKPEKPKRSVYYKVARIESGLVEFVVSPHLLKSYVSEEPGVKYCSPNQLLETINEFIKEEKKEATKKIQEVEKTISYLDEISCLPDSNLSP